MARTRCSIEVLSVHDLEIGVSFQQGLAKIVSSLFFIVAKNDRRHTAATVINFGSRNGNFEMDTAAAVSRALAHRADRRPILPGIGLALPKREPDRSRAGSDFE